MHPTLGILRKSQAVFYASAFFQSDGVPPPAPARVTQTVSQRKASNIKETTMLLAKSSRMMWLGIGLVLLVAGCALTSDTPIAETSQPAPSPFASTVSPTQNTVAIEATVKLIMDQPLTDHSGGVEGLTFSPDSKILASIYKNGKIILWDVNTHQSLRSFTGGGETGEFGMMLGVAFSPDGKFLATKANGVAPVLWDVTTGQSIEVERGLSHSDGMALSSDGKLLAYGKCEGLNAWSQCNQYEIAFWDVNTYQPVGQPLSFRVGAAAPLGLLFSPDGKTLAAMSSGTTGSGKIELFNVDARQPIESPLGSKVQFSSMAFSPDGNFMALGAIGGVIYIWNVKSHEVISELRGENGVVTGITFSPNGKTLAARIFVPSAEDTPHEKIVLWDIGSFQTLGQPLTRQSATGGEVGLISTAFSLDSMTLATGTDDGVIILWNLATKDSQGP
jgi:WD40 repeat protein